MADKYLYVVHDVVHCVIVPLQQNVTVWRSLFCRFCGARLILGLYFLQTLLHKYYYTNGKGRAYKNTNKRHIRKRLGISFLSYHFNKRLAERMVI